MLAITFIVMAVMIVLFIIALRMDMKKNFARADDVMLGVLVLDLIFFLLIINVIRYN